MLNRYIGTLHNLSKHVPCRIHFTNCHAVEVLVPFLKAEVTLYATKALLTLAYLLDEENNELIMSDKGEFGEVYNSLVSSPYGLPTQKYTMLHIANSLNQVINIIKTYCNCLSYFTTAKITFTSTFESN